MKKAKDGGQKKNKVKRKEPPSLKKLVAKNPAQIEGPAYEIGVMNATPAQLYSQHPCMIAFTYMRLEVTGEVRACCIAKHAIGDLHQGNWRQIWRSEAYSAFRAKMLRIHKERFHLKDPEYLFCQQCSHMTLNLLMIEARQEKKHGTDE
jgi:hypothetical protein